MSMDIDFSDLQMKPLLYGLISQAILPFDDLTMNINEGDVCGITFNNNRFKDYNLLITNVSVTSLKRVTNNDISRNGFVYKPAFINFMKNYRNVDADDSIMKLDFELVENKR